MDVSTFHYACLDHLGHWFDLPVEFFHERDLRRAGEPHPGARQAFLNAVERSVLTVVFGGDFRHDAGFDARARQDVVRPRGVDRRGLRRTDEHGAFVALHIIYRRPAREHLDGLDEARRQALAA